MGTITLRDGTNVPPKFVTVKDAARILALSPWTMYQRLDAGLIDSRYEGRRRLVDYASLMRYADNLPSTPPEG